MLRLVNNKFGGLVVRNSPKARAALLLHCRLFFRRARRHAPRQVAAEQDVPAAGGAGRKPQLDRGRRRAQRAHGTVPAGQPPAASRPRRGRARARHDAGRGEGADAARRRGHRGRAQSRG